MTFLCWCAVKNPLSHSLTVTSDVVQVGVTSTPKVQTAVWYYSLLNWPSHLALDFLIIASVSGISSTASRHRPSCGCTSAVTRCTRGRSGAVDSHQGACGLAAWWRWDVELCYRWFSLPSLDVCLPALPLTTSASCLAAVTWVIVTLFFSPLSFV